LKLLHVSSEKTWRGGEQQIAYLIQELKNKGVQNVVLCKTGSDFESFCKEHDIDFYTSPFSSNLDLLSSIKLKTICRIENPDIIHTHSSRSHSTALYACWLGIKTPLVVSRRVDFPIKTGWKYNSTAVKRIICVSDFIRQIVIPKIRQTAKCITIHSGIDINKFNDSKNKSLLREYGFKESFKAVGNTSAIADHKDYFTFVDAAEWIIKDRMDVAFFIIGNGPLKNDINEYILSKGLENNIIMTGFRNDITDILPALDCFLMTSKTEGLGTSLLDSIAAGVPVVATRGGGIPEIIIHEKTGLLSEIGDSRDLGEQVKRILDNEDLADALVSGGLEYVKNFIYQSMAEKTYQEYQSVLVENSN